MFYIYLQNYVVYLTLTLFVVAFLISPQVFSFVLIFLFPRVCLFFIVPPLFYFAVASLFCREFFILLWLFGFAVGFGFAVTLMGHRINHIKLGY